MQTAVFFLPRRDSHHTQPLRSLLFLFGKLPCKHDFCGGDNNSSRLLCKRPSFPTRRDSHHTQPLRSLLFYLVNCRASTTFAVETIIQVVCLANGRLLPAPEGLSPHATAPLFAFFIWQITVQARLLPNKKSNLKVLFRLRVVETIRLELMTSTMST